MIDKRTRTLNEMIEQIEAHKHALERALRLLDESLDRIKACIVNSLENSFTVYATEIAIEATETLWCKNGSVGPPIDNGQLLGLLYELKMFEMEAM